MKRLRDLLQNTLPILLLLVLPLLLTGCFEDKGAIYAHCVMNYNNMRNADPDSHWLHVWGGPTEYITTCMRAEGYKLDASNCKPSGFAYQELACYHHVGLIDRITEPNEK